jgi:hypothetical protein
VANLSCRLDFPKTYRFKQGPKRPFVTQREMVRLGGCSGRHVPHYRSADPSMNGTIGSCVNGNGSSAVVLQNTMEFREPLRVIGEHHQPHTAQDCVEVRVREGQRLTIFDGKGNIGQST